MRVLAFSFLGHAVGRIHNRGHHHRRDMDAEFPMVGGLGSLGPLYTRAKCFSVAISPGAVPRETDCPKSLIHECDLPKQLTGASMGYVKSGPIPETMDGALEIVEALRKKCKNYLGGGHFGGLIVPENDFDLGDGHYGGLIMGGDMKGHLHHALKKRGCVGGYLDAEGNFHDACEERKKKMGGHLHHALKKRGCVGGYLDAEGNFVDACKERKKHLEGIQSVDTDDKEGVFDTLVTGAASGIGKGMVEASKWL